MKRRDFLKQAAIAAATPLALTQCSLLSPMSGEKVSPNVLLIITDDQRWDTLSCAGNSILKTPSLDRLAAEGVRFENAFVTTSTCAPSRASILTGKYVHSHGAWSIGWPIPEGQRSVYEILQENGYHTGHVGKWHMTRARRTPVPEADRRGIDDWRGVGAFLPYIHEDGQHHTEWEMEQALEFLGQRPKDRPFILGIGFQAPHDPLVPNPKHEKLFEDVVIPPRPYAKESRERAPEPAKTAGGLKSWEYKVGDPEKYQNTMKNYYRLIVGMDEAVGRILDTLDEQGLSENTLVIFISDNGLFMGEHGLAGKHYPYEESIRVPLIVRYPPLTKAAAGNVRDEMALTIDVAPTILETIGLSIPEDMEGLSLCALMQSNAAHKTWRRSWLYEYACPSGSPPMEAVRTERWKYIAIIPSRGPPSSCSILRAIHTRSMTYRDPWIMRARWSRCEPSIRNCARRRITVSGARIPTTPTNRGETNCQRRKRKRRRSLNMGGNERSNA